MNKLLVNVPFVVCDIETTGLSPIHNRIIEIALLRIENFKIVDTFTTLINPKTFIQPFISQLTGIRNEDVVDAPEFSDVVFHIRNFIKDSVLVAHNAAFDHKFLIHSFLRENLHPPSNPVLCTKLLAKRVIPKLSSYGLGSLTSFYKIKNIQPHRAFGDALATSHLLLKLIEEGTKKFLINDLDSLLSLQYQPIKSLNEVKIKKTIADQIPLLPTKSGVYIFKNKNGEIIYIGKAKNLRSRVLSYFRSNEKRDKKITRSAHYLEFIDTGSELSAFLLESELIKKHKPRYNKTLKILRRYSFIALQNDHQFPRLEVTTRITEKGAMFFGPFQKRETAEQVLDIISKSTSLRECDDKTLNKNRPCYLLDIKRCLGPCINNSIKLEYDREIEIVKSFLTGNNLNILNRLIEKMKEYSTREKFEEAAKIRDTIRIIINNMGRIKVLKEPINSLNAIIIIFDGLKPVEFIGLKDGILIFTTRYEEDDNFLGLLVEDYFSKYYLDFDLAINIEKIKIIANFLVNQKARYKIIYTSSLTKEELYNQLRLSLLEV